MNTTLSLCLLGLTSALFVNSAKAAVSVSFIDESATYDAKTSTNVSIFDPVSSVNFMMTVTSSGGDLNSNSTGLGVGDANLNDGEIIQISFSVNTLIEILDLGGIGADVSDGARVTISSNPSFDLYTGQPDFNGISDVWSPTSSVSLLAGEVIEFRTSSPTASFDLDGITLSAVPEPSSSLLFTFGSLALLCRRKKNSL